MTGVSVLAAGDNAPTVFCDLHSHGAMAAFFGVLIGWFAARRKLVVTILIGAGTLAMMGLSLLVLWQFRAIVPMAALVATLVASAMFARLVRTYVVRE